MTGVLGLVAAVFALCPSPEDVRVELEDEGVTLSADLKIVVVERGEVVEVALFRGEQRLDAAVVEGNDCASRTLSAAAFVAGWSAELSRAVDAPVVRRRIGKRPKQVPVLHRFTAEGMATFMVTGVGFQGVLDYALSVGPGVFSIGGFVDLTPDTNFPAGVLSRSTFGGLVGAGMEGVSPHVALAGTVSLMLGGAILSGPGYDPETMKDFELAVRIGFRVRWPSLRFLPGISFAGTLWPLREPPRLQVLMPPSPLAWWELGVGAHFSLFP